MDDVDVRAVSGDEWGAVAWLWQCFRHDLATIVTGLPHADGRYATRGLPDQASSNTAGYLAWRPHPKTEELAPIGFAVIDGLSEERRSLAALWVAPVVRREGIGRRLALDVIERHPGPWSLAFQHDNVRAGTFWRRVADEAFGISTWHEEERRVPGVPGAPPDHWIETI
jgi:GNAT superfamily N-acetyltransferase